MNTVPRDPFVSILEFRTEHKGQLEILTMELIFKSFSFDETLISVSQAGNTSQYSKKVKISCFISFIPDRLTTSEGMRCRGHVPCEGHNTHNSFNRSNSLNRRFLRLVARYRRPDIGGMDIGQELNTLNLRKNAKKKVNRIIQNTF